MKNYFKSAMFASLLAVALSFTACQKEYDPIVEVDHSETMTVNSAAANLMAQMASNDGSYDNIVDGASCFSIRFPYIVSVNGLQVNVDAIEDLRIIEEIFDAVDGDDDVLDILFPVTITMADYEEILINGIEDLREHANACVEGGGDDDIECIDVIYPVTFFTYNINQEQNGSVTVESDKDMRRFFLNLDGSALVSIQFPIMFKMYDGTKITVNAMPELRETLERAKDACDEDDDNDHNDDDFTKERLDNLLTECPWLVWDVKRHNLISTPQYESYLMTFNEDGTVVVKDREGNMLHGEWITRVSEYKVLLKLQFEFLVDFNVEWFVYEIDSRKIKLYAGETDKIILRSTCGEEPIACSEAIIGEALAQCTWSVANANGSFLEYLDIDFSNMNIHVFNPNGEVVDEGNWEINHDVLTLNNLSMTLANYIGDWVVIECSAQRFKLKRGDEYLILEMECASLNSGK